MRYYDIKLTSVQTGAVAKQWTSLSFGIPNMNAQDVELDIYAYDEENPAGDSKVTIWGISIQDIQQANSFASSSEPKFNIEVKAGMVAGLPLAHPEEAGTILKGYVWLSWANWIGTAQNLSFIIKAGGASYGQPANIVFNWQVGTPLSQALTTCLQNAFPDLKPSIQIADTYTPPNHQPAVHVARSLYELAYYVSSLTIKEGQHPVRIAVSNGVIRVYDGSTITSPVRLQFTDMIGQPTWVDQVTLLVMVVMRAGIQVGDFIQMPVGLQGGPGAVINVPSSLSTFRDFSAFQGVFQVGSIRHVGRFRDPDATLWTTVLRCYYQAAGS